MTDRYDELTQDQDIANLNSGDLQEVGGLIDSITDLQAAIADNSRGKLDSEGPEEYLGRVWEEWKEGIRHETGELEPGLGYDLSPQNTAHFEIETMEWWEANIDAVSDPGGTPSPRQAVPLDDIGNSDGDPFDGQQISPDPFTGDGPDSEPDGGGGSLTRLLDVLLSLN
jgi:hypothetical protein